jgi:protein-S-isoprenylcysteine O-methyltransferase Ste14
MNKNLQIFLVPMILILFLWIVLFLPVGTIDYPQAWILWGSFSLVTVIIGIYFSKTNPEFLIRRSQPQKEKRSNRTPSIFKVYYLGFILPGLDYRFHWSSVPLWLSFIATVLVILAYLFIFRVFVENAHASATIQVETTQQAVTTGPYRVVRHPMYSGMVIISLLMPLALGSLFALLPMAMIIPILVFRIRQEEQLLLMKLAGYQEYCKKTKYRLIPFIW